jgi:raffinose/stachyose/melibiose transport system substrate-binding protein
MRLNEILIKKQMEDECMKKILKATSLILTMAMFTAALGGCGSASQKDDAATDSAQDTSAETTDSKDTGDYEFYIFNTKGENAEALQAAVDAYSMESGETIKVFSVGSGTDSADLLRSELSSSKMPTIFCCSNRVDLIEFTEGGYAMNLSDAANEDFKKLVTDIPENMILADSNGSYGIPFNIEGYGYIADTRMIAALFGEENVDAFVTAYKTATYAEFEAMVKAVTDYIKNDTLSTITLSGKSFQLNAKSGLASSLTGVFSVAGSQTWTYGDHLINIPVDGAFQDASATMSATAEQVDAAKPLFKAYAQTIDLVSSNATIARGAELINTTTSGYDASVQNFAEGKALFIQQGNWAYTNMIKFNKEIGNDLTFLPIKTPITDDMMQVNGLTAEHLNSSIPVFVPNYYVINKKATDAQKEAAEKFLVWLNTTQQGQKFVVEDMAFIPYNAEAGVTSAGYSLGDSILTYVKEGNTITNAYVGCPNSWAGDTVGAYIMENYLNSESWASDAYDNIADYAVSTWKEMAGLN